ncbi:MAG: hypothetical protein GY796_22965, partial [Chloroflexi bacterium]|nr:hypothetical protein [Chloroflexota bacterium]
DLKVAAAHFRRSAAAWDALSLALLPEEISPFKEMRELLLQRRDLFTTQGNAALAELGQIDERLEALKKEMETDFPLDAAGVTTMRQNIADHVMQVHDIESEAVSALKAAMA